MTNIRAMLTSALITLTVSLVILTAILVITDMQAVQADTANQPIITNAANTYYLPLTDTPPQRDITTQRFAPLEETP
jgi:hypothetical protein